jgi:hypothetical protein
MSVTISLTHCGNYMLVVYNEDKVVLFEKFNNIEEVCKYLKGDIFDV